MSTPLTTPGPQRIIYPETDGKPIAENTLQFEWIVTIKNNLEALYRNDMDVFVAGDLLWYPVKGTPGICQAPDILVAFGRPKGYRGSYLQWEEGGIAPQVVFEILSPGNRQAELYRKFSFYEKYGVEECYVYDPDRNVLEGWRRVGNELVEIPAMDGWVSPRMKIRFHMEAEKLRIEGPDGQRFLTFVEMAQEKAKAEQRLIYMAAKLRELGVDPNGG